MPVAPSQSWFVNGVLSYPGKIRDPLFQPKLELALGFISYPALHCVNHCDTRAVSEPISPVSGRLRFPTRRSKTLERKQEQPCLPIIILVNVSNSVGSEKACSSCSSNFHDVVPTIRAHQSLLRTATR